MPCLFYFRHRMYGGTTFRKWTIRKWTIRHTTFRKCSPTFHHKTFRNTTFRNMTFSKGHFANGLLARRLFANGHLAIRHSANFSIFVFFDKKIMHYLHIFTKSPFLLPPHQFCNYQALLFFHDLLALKLKSMHIKEGRS